MQNLIMFILCDIKTHWSTCTLNRSFTSDDFIYHVLVIRKILVFKCPGHSENSYFQMLTHFITQYQKSRLLKTTIALLKKSLGLLRIHQV